jgi:hypothetical protein
MIELNPLNVLNKRSLKWLPPHFAKSRITFSAVFQQEKIDTWIKHRLKGRYCVLHKPDSSNTPSLVVGFEDEKELTYFMLACPYLRRN